MLRKFSTTAFKLARNRPILSKKLNDIDEFVDSVVDNWFDYDPKNYTKPSPKLASESDLEVNESGDLQAKGLSKLAANEPTQPTKRPIEEYVKALEIIEKGPIAQKPNMNNFYDDRHQFIDADKQAEPKDMEWFQDTIVNMPEHEQIPRWLRVADKIEPISRNIRKNEGPLNVLDIKRTLERESAINITVIDVKYKCDHMEYLLICEGMTERHVYSLAESIRKLVKNQYYAELNMPHNLEVDGAETNDWMVIDLGTVMVHCFTAEKRAEVNLEGMWEEIPAV